MSDRTELDGLFGDEETGEEVTVTPEPEGSTEPDATQKAEGDDKAGETDETPDAEKGKETEPPSVEKPDEASGYKTAMLAERRKRQEVEDRLRQIEQQNQTPKKEESIYDDPDGFVASRVNQVEQKMTVRILQMSEETAREQFPDYDEKINAFNEAAERNPALMKQMVNSTNPARFAYQTGETYLVTKDAPTIGDLREKLRKEWEATERPKIEKEIQNRLRSQTLSNVPDSLTEETGTVATAKPEGGPTPIESIYD